MASVSEYLQQYEDVGFVHLPGVIPAPHVARLREAFDRAAAAHKPVWEEQVRAGQAPASYFDIPNILDVDDSFVDLADLDTVLPLLRKAIGEDIQLNHTHARVMFPGKTFTAPWHSDLETLIGVNLATSPNFFAKVHFYFQDLHPDQGCLAFIPGTHRLPQGAPRPKIADVATSTEAVRIVPKAGDAVLFNVHVQHMALDNKTDMPRKSLIYAFSHFWLKNYANAVPSDLDRVATTAVRQQLFGMEAEGVSYFDQRLDLDSVLSSETLANRGKRFLKRVLKGSSVTKTR